MLTFRLSGFADEAAGDLPGQIEALRRNGIRMIEPRNVGGSVAALDDRALWEIRARLDEAGIGVSSLGSPIGKTPWDVDFGACLRAFDRALAACRILGAGRMRVFSFFVPEGERAERREAVLQRMNALLDRAEAAGVTLCHENESGIWGQNPEQVSDLLSSLPRLRGIFDAANFVMEGQDPLLGFRATLPSLAYLHVKDASAARREIVPMGAGDGRWSEVFDLLEERCEGEMILSLEPHLCMFNAYREIDRHPLRAGVRFTDPGSAFDTAAGALRGFLTARGYREEKGVWTR